MSSSQDPIEIAKQAERDLNTQEAKGNTKRAGDEGEYSIIITNEQAQKSMY